MKKLIFFLVCAVALLAGCKTDEPENDKVESIAFLTDAYEVILGESKVLFSELNILPKAVGDTAVVTWSSEKEEVAKVSKGGVVSAVSVGSTIITATAQGKSAECFLKVTSNVSLAEFKKSSYELNIGETLDLSSELNIEFKSEDNTDLEIIWGSDKEEIAKVNDKGVLEAVSVGEVAIWAKVSGKKIKCKVTIKEVTKPEVIIPVQSIVLTENVYESCIGGTASLEYAILPENATFKDVIWKSSNEAVVKVNQNGMMSFVGEGEASVYAEHEAKNEKDVSVKSKNCVVTVKDCSIPESFDATLDNKSICEGDKATIQISNILPDEANAKSLEWTVSNPSVLKLTIDASGKKASVEGLKEGNASVTIKSKSGFSKTLNITVNSRVTSLTWEEDDFCMFVGTSTTIARPSAGGFRIFYELDYAREDIKGLSFNKETRTLTAETVGVYYLTAKAIDLCGNYIEKEITIEVIPDNKNAYIPDDAGGIYYGTFGMKQKLQYYKEQNWRTNPKIEITNLTHKKMGDNNAVTLSADKKTAYFNFLGKRGFSHAQEQILANYSQISYILKVTDSRGISKYFESEKPYYFFNSFLGYVYWYDKSGSFDENWNSTDREALDDWLDMYTYDRNATVTLYSSFNYILTAAMYVKTEVNGVPYVGVYVHNEEPTPFPNQMYMDKFAPEISDILGIDYTYLLYKH